MKYFKVVFVFWNSFIFLEKNDISESPYTPKPIYPIINALHKYDIIHQNNELVKTLSLLMFILEWKQRSKKEGHDCS